MSLLKPEILGVVSRGNPENKAGFNKRFPEEFPEVITPEENMYRNLDRIFRKLSLPFMLLTAFLFLDFFLKPVEINTVVEYIDDNPRSLYIYTPEGSFKLLDGVENLYPGREISLRHTMILDIPLQVYSERGEWLEVNKNFKEYFIILFIAFFCSLMGLVSPNRDFRMFGGAVSYVLLFVFLLILAIYT